MYKFLLSLFFFLSLSTTIAQNGEDPLTIGTKHILFSERLQEEREYWVYLPECYFSEDTSSYPVIYLLDAHINFHTLTGIQKMLSRGRRGGSIPKMIVVGIVNTDRTRDFTPTKAKQLPEKFRSNPAMLQNGGGADNFLAFLSEELIPTIETTYRSNGTNTLIGHSFGGLFTLYALFSQPKLFNNYLAIDPSFWWDDGFILQYASKNKNTWGTATTKLYFSSANHPQKFDSGETLKNLLEKSNPEKLHWHYDYFEDENHGSVILPSQVNGLKYLFFHGQ